MRTSRFGEVIAAAAAVVAGVVAAGAVFVSDLGNDEERLQVADLASAATAQVNGEAQKPVAAPKTQAPAVSPVQKFVATPKPARASCSARKGDVAIQVDALVHALGVAGGVVRSEAAESKVLARPGRGNACTKNIKLFMGEDYAFEGRLPYGNWVLDVSGNGVRKSFNLVVDRAGVAAPKQVLDGDCGGVASVEVRTRTEDSAMGLSGPLPTTLVTAKRVPDGECAVPATSTFTTGATGSFVGSLGYGDWMFTRGTGEDRISEFVTVDKNTDEIVLTRTIDLLG